MKLVKKWSLRTRKDENVLTHLLVDRGYSDGDSRTDFLNPVPPEKLIDNPERTGLSRGSLAESTETIQKAVTEGWPIVIHGDYDVDGLCAAAILWQTIYQDLGYKNCRPFIPNRFDHGYGLSRSSVNSMSNLSDSGDISHLKTLLITVDCGLTAYDSVEYAKEKGFEVLVVDHHTPPEKLPDCQIFWTDKMCAAGLAWVLSRFLRLPESELRPQGRLRESGSYDDLAALATVADLQPLTGFNRSLVKFGLAELNRTENIGLKALIKVGGIEGRKIGVFEVGWVLAPRLNASGRLENAMESLRLLCTHDPNQAAAIAGNLNRINSERQELTRAMVELAKGQLENPKLRITSYKFTVAVHEQFHEGIIGLVAGRLVQEYGAPSIVISKGVEFSKASARSVSGFNIVEFLRSLGDHFQDIGGHAGAAGFTLRTEKIDPFISAISEKQQAISLPKPVLEIDAQLSFEELNLNLLTELKRLEPFGLGNPEPIFLLKKAQVVEARTVGFKNQHLKLRVIRGQRLEVRSEESSLRQLVSSLSTLASAPIDCIGFDLGDRLGEITVGDCLDLVFVLSEDSFNGNRKLSLKLKDLRPSGES